MLKHKMCRPKEINETTLKVLDITLCILPVVFQNALQLTRCEKFALDQLSGEICLDNVPVAL